MSVTNARNRKNCSARPRNEQKRPGENRNVKSAKSGRGRTEQIESALKR